MIPSSGFQQRGMGSLGVRPDSEKAAVELQFAV